MVFDLISKELKLRRPLEKRYYGAVMMNNDALRGEILTFGFVKSVFKKKEFKNVQRLPVYLIQMIGKWYCGECVYLINDEREGLVIMKVDDIMDEELKLSEECSEPLNSYSQIRVSDDESSGDSEEDRDGDSGKDSDGDSDGDSDRNSDGNSDEDSDA